MYVPSFYPLQAYLEEVNAAAFRNFATGAAAAIELLASMGEVHAQEKKRCEEMGHLAEMFECPREMNASKEMIVGVGEMLGQFNALWKCAQECHMYMDEACEMLWSELNPEGLEDNAKMLVANVKKLPKAVKDSNAYV